MHYASLNKSKRETFPLFSIFCSGLFEMENIAIRLVVFQRKISAVNAAKKSHLTDKTCPYRSQQISLMSPSKTDFSSPLKRRPQKKVKYASDRASLQTDASLKVCPIL